MGVGIKQSKIVFEVILDGQFSGCPYICVYSTVNLFIFFNVLFVNRYVQAGLPNFWPTAKCRYVNHCTVQLTNLRVKISIIFGGGFWNENWNHSLMYYFKSWKFIHVPCQWLFFWIFFGWLDVNILMICCACKNCFCLFMKWDTLVQSFKWTIFW